MNRLQLKARLDELGIMESAYCLTGGLPSEAYTLAERDGAWRVYYSERGGESHPVDFASEAEACVHLLQLLEGDRTTRARTSPGS